MKRRNDLIPMVGRRFGGLLVVAEAGRRHFKSGAKPHRRVIVRCGCGAEYETDAPSVRRGAQSCRACAAPRRGLAASVRLPDGRTIAQIAAATGLKLDTVYHRFIRGWPHHRLGEVAQRKGARS